MHILIIDDDAVDRMLFKHFIQDADSSIQVTEAENGKRGLKKIKNNEYDCIFVDYLLPDMDGIDLLKQLYNPVTELAPYPAVVLTGQGKESIIIDALKYGAQDYLLKDAITSNGLLSVIEKARHGFNIKKVQNETKQKLHHAQKIDALGKLTGGIAHDFNNILTIILGHTKLLKLIMEDENPDLEHQIRKIDTIERAAQRGADLVQHLMVFSHQRTLDPSPVNINHLITNMYDLLQQTIGKTVTIESDLKDSLWHTNVDATQLEHVIINMSANARDAMPDGGILTLRTNNETLSKEDAQRLNIPPGSYVRMTLSDTGTGIPPEIQDNIFDPFFTTKGIGKGTGLGMSMAYSFVKECGGTIDLKSEVGQGTSFTLYFPKCIAQEVPQEPQSESPDRPERGHGTILVAEDEDEIRTLAEDILEAHGYTVLQAANTEQALELIQDTATEIDLLFTDLCMPGDMNGVQLTARALEIRPEMKILFTTGFMKNAIPDMNLLEGYPTLDKPYEPDQLLIAIEGALRHEKQ